MQQDLIRLLLSLAIGIVIGAEREYRNKNAGFRTMILISIGSTLFTLASIHIVGDASATSRITANIITGIGFLGAGAIFKDGNTVNGLTTATTIWITAALGMTIGLGFYAISFIGLALTLIVLWELVKIQYIIDRAHRKHRYKIVFNNPETETARVESIMSNFGLEFSLRGLTKRGTTVTYTWEVQGQSNKHEMLVAALISDPLIIEFDY